MEPESLDDVLRRNLVARNKQTLVVNNPDGSSTFSCVVCPMKYDDKESMELHLCMHNKEYRFICSICGTGLKRKEHLERHTQGHYEVRPHVCPECGKAFKRKEHLNIHYAIHTGRKELNCPMCARSFHRKDHLQKHFQSHSKKFMRQGVSVDDVVTQVKTELDEDLNPMILNVCGNVTELDQNSADESSQPAPVDPLRPFQCGRCPKTYKRRDHLKLHERTHNKHKFPCSECGINFPTEGQLFVHMNQHLKAESLLECENEQPALQIAENNPPWKNLTTEGLLVRVVKKEEYRPHECQICHKRFKRRQHLITHGNVHRKNRSIWCSLCNEGFTTNNEFEEHECKMLNENGGDSENINDVQMQNNVMDEYIDHSEYFEKEPEKPSPTPPAAPPLPLPLPVPQRMFVCKYCSKPFRRRDHYKIHLNIHTGEKSFFCTHCGKGFYRKDHLQKHEPIHLRQKRKKEMPDLFPISSLQNIQKSPALMNLPNLPEITIHAPSNTKLRIPLQMKVPYEVVTSTEHGEQRAVIHPQEQCVR